jgi:ribosomal protein L18
MKTLKRRRLERKTNYSKRLKLLKGGSFRIIFRKTNKYLISQCVSSKGAQDKILFGFTSKNLYKYGWPEEFKGSLKSVPSAYLLGLLMGEKIIKEKIKEPIVDFGMLRTKHKSKVYGFLKGLIDSGIKIKCKEEFFPSEERIIGKKLKKDFAEHFQKIKQNIEKGKND